MTQASAREDIGGVLSSTAPALNVLRYGALSQAFAFVMNLRSHFVLSSRLRKLGMLNYAEFDGGVRYRYLRKYYLGGGFSVPHRLLVAITHHQQVGEHFRGNFLKLANLRGGFTLWQRSIDSVSLLVALRLPYRYNYDGDLCLTLGVDGKDACIVTFSIGPGDVVGAGCTPVLLISSVQGIAGSIDSIRIATEVCDNVSPAHLLLMAAETLAAAIGIKLIVGIGHSHMPRINDTLSTQKVFDYDAFWMALTGVEVPQNFYHIPVPFSDKPIETIPAKHRSRSRKRRELRNLIRQEIQAQAISALAHNCLRDSASPAPLAS